VFAVIGEALLDMVQPVPGGAFSPRPGGGPMNIAVGLKRLGHPTALMARLSTSALGDIVRHHIERNELGLAACVSTTDQTTLAFATLDEERRASYEFYVQGTADWGWTDLELGSLPPDTAAVHTGSLAGFLTPGADAIMARWQRWHAEQRLLLSFDPNVRPALAGPRAEAVSRVERFVAASHVVKASNEDLEWLYPEQPPDEAVRRWAQLGPELVVMTRGADGCLALRRDGGAALERPGRSVTVVDTIGAGDAFESGLLSGIADATELRPGSVDRLSDVDLLSVLDRWILVSALTCQREGADPPSRAEYDDAMAG
jgi:fructokinase